MSTISNAKKSSITCFVLSISFLLGIAINLYVPSFPALVEYFHTTSGLVQLTIGFYMLAFAIGQFFLGILADTLGRKIVMKFCAIGFMLASILSIFAPNIEMLIFYRFLQGLTLGGMGAVIRAIAADCMEGVELAKITSSFTITWALGPIVSPVIGGYLQHYFNWQADFYLFSGYGIAIVVYVFWFLPETRRAAATFKTLTWYQSVKQIITSSFFLYSAMILALTEAALLLFNVIGPFLVQGSLKYSVIAYGYITLFLGLGCFLGGIASRFLINYFKPMKLIVLAIGGGLIVSVVMVFLGIFVVMNLWIIAIPVFFLMFFGALIFPNVIAEILGHFPHQAGTASALFGTMFALGVFLMTLFATKLNTVTQLPMTVTYLGLFLCCWLLFLAMRRAKRLFEIS